MPPADETEVYHRMHKWYHSPECDALRAAWGPYPATPAALQSWPGFVAVTNAFLDSDAADDRPAAAAAAEPVAAEAEEPIAAETEESEPVGASEVVPEVVEGEEGVVTEPVGASETMEREAPAEGAADEPRGWPSSLLEPRREGGVEVDVEAPRGVHTLRSWNYPQRRWRVAEEGDTVKIDEGPGTTLRVVPGLYRPGDESGARDWNAALFAERGAASMVSFALDDGTYLRSNLIGELRAHRPDESGRFRLDATFYAERDRFYPGSVSFHSVNHNGFYISHGSRFVLKTYYCCDEPDLRRETKKNASFALETPAASADESRGWFSWLLGPRRESGATADAEASKPKIKQAAGEAVASIEFLGRWNDNIDDLAMPVKFKAKYYGGDHFVRVVLGKLVDELVRNKAPSGILAINHRSYKECGSPRHEQLFSWSVSPDDLSFQRHGFADMKSRHKNIRFADFEGAIDTLGSDHKSAVYRVTLPSGGLDRSKWAGRPPPPAPEELYSGPRDDGLLSTDEISGEYCAPGCSEDCRICRSMTVVPLGADAIEMWSSGCLFFPCLWGSIGPTAETEVRTRKPGTNDFVSITFSADGTTSGGYKKRPN